MKRRPMTLIAVLLLGAASFAQAQKTTERFIPIGQSPGVSGKTTIIGSVGAVDVAGRSLSVQSATGSQRVGVTDATRIWLGAAGQPTRVGTLADLRAGRRVEVKFPDANTRTTAEWIKVDAAVP
jgi:hypothetical protein